MARDAASRGVRIGHVAGVEMCLDWSLLIVLWLLVAGLGLGVLPTWHATWSPLLLWTTAVVAACLFIASIALHELAHAIAGRRHGIVVRRITLFLFGGVAQIEREPRSPSAELWMAIAGPATSLAVGIGATVLGLVLSEHALVEAADVRTAMSSLGVAATVLLWLGPVNILLALFNLLPGFPLDGGRVFRAVVWRLTGDRYKATVWASWLGRVLGWALMGSGVLMALGMWIPVLGTGLLPGLWLLLLGWFLHAAARGSHHHLVLHEMLRDVPVTALMQTNLISVGPRQTLAELIRDCATHSDQSAFPVYAHAQFRGLVHLADIRNVPSDCWHETRVGDVCTPIHRVRRVSVEDSAHTAFQQLLATPGVELVVMDRGQLCGLVSERDITRWIALKSGLALTPRGFSDESASSAPWDARRGSGNRDAA